MTRDGHPILVEIEDIERLFDHGAPGSAANDDPGDSGEPVVRRVWVLDNVGSAEEPRGVRGLENVGDDLHLISGNLDNAEVESALLADHPEGGQATAQHHRFRLPDSDDGGAGRVRAELVATVGEETKIEGLSIDADGRFLYVVDDKRIRLRPAS